METSTEDVVSFISGSFGGHKDFFLAVLNQLIVMDSLYQETVAHKKIINAPIFCCCFPSELSFFPYLLYSHELFVICLMLAFLGG